MAENDWIAATIASPLPVCPPPDKLAPVHEKPGAYLAARYREFESDCKRISKRLRQRFPEMAAQFEHYAYVWEGAAQIAAEYERAIMGTPNGHGDVTRTDPLIKGFLQTIAILTEQIEKGRTEHADV